MGTCLKWGWTVGLALWCALASAAVTIPVAIDLRVHIAAGAFDPQRDAVSVRGSHAPLSWQQPLLARPDGSGWYRVNITFERMPFGGQPVQYKFRIERPHQAPDQGWEPGGNHTMSLRDGIRIERAFGATAEPAVWTRVGHIERLGWIESLHVSRRQVQVWLPPAYHQDPSRRFPVLYLHDGQNVFDGASAGGEWMVDETAQRLTLVCEIDAPIIVAVDSVASRTHDYTPTPASLSALRTASAQPALVGGGAAAYGKFLTDELKPLIDTRYRTQPGRNSTSVGGSSLGGLVSLWLAWYRSDVFGAALVVSPSLWWGDAWAQKEIERWQSPPANRARLWLDMGHLEGQEALAAAQRLHIALRRAGWDAASLTYVEDQLGGHDEASWASRVEGMLRFLYPPPANPRVCQ